MAGPGTRGTDDAPVELELRDYLRVLGRRKFTVLFTLLVVVGSAVALSLVRTPVYEGQARVLLKARLSESVFGSAAIIRTDPDREIQTEIQVLKSQPVRDLVRERLGQAPGVSAGPVGRTDVIEVRARSTEAKRAAAVANAYANAYIDHRRRQAVDDLEAAGREVRNRINELQRQIDDLAGQITAAPAPQRPTVERTVTPQRDALIQQQGVFRQRLEVLQADAALKTGGAQLVAAASTPRSPADPRPVGNAILAGVVGLVLGVGLAFLLEHLDESIKSKEDFQRAAPGLPVLGMIPSVPAWRTRDDPFVVALREPTSPAAESYRTLRTAVQFLALDRPMSTVQVTSPGAGEGKSTTLANLAVSMSEAGLSVVIVCCDLRRPRIHEFFGLDNEKGFTSVLLGELPLSVALQPVPGRGTRLSLLASGPLPPNPSELLSSRRTAEVLTSLQAEADVVLIDSPPVLPVTDALVLSGRVDATLLVCVPGVTSRKEVARAVELLGQVEAPLVGAVLNGVTEDAGYGSSYRYYRYEPAGRREAARGT